MEYKINYIKSHLGFVKTRHEFKSSELSDMIDWLITNVKDSRYIVIAIYYRLKDEDEWSILSSTNVIDKSSFRRFMNDYTKIFSFKK